MGLDALKSFVQPPPSADVCGLCAAALAEPHPHLFDRTRETLECACPTCALLFVSETSPRWRPVPHRAERVAVNPIGDALWASLGLPIGLAFFVQSASAARVIAWYPGPAGATRCQLSFELPSLGLTDDIEALLVNRLDGANAAYRLSLDECFSLVGLVRARWRGFGGGPAVKQAVADFCARMEAADA